MPLIPAAPNKNQKEAAGFKKHPQELTAPERSSITLYSEALQKQGFPLRKQYNQLAS